MTKCDFYIHQLNTQTPQKKNENYIDAKSSFRPRCMPFDFQGGYSNDEWILLLHDIQFPYICVCLFVSICYMHTYTHTLNSFVLFSSFLKMLIVISNFTWFVANFDSHPIQTHNTSQTKTSNKCNDKVFVLRTVRAKKARAPHSYTNTNCSSWYAVCLTPHSRRFTFRIDFSCHVNWSMEFNAWRFFSSESPKIKIITYYRAQNVLCAVCVT